MLDLLLSSWDAVQIELRRRVGEAAYSAWLQDLRPLAMERGMVFCEAANTLIRDHVRRLYAPLLTDLLSAEFGTRMTAEILAPEHEVDPTVLEVDPTRPIVDEGNEQALLVLRGLLQHQELPGSLFCFHGPSGVGKTYLLRWWINQAQGAGLGRPMVFEGDKLGVVFRTVCGERRRDEFFDELTSRRPLLIDGVHRIQGQPKLQAFLARVLDARERGKFSKPPELGIRRAEPKRAARKDSVRSLIARTTAGMKMVTQNMPDAINTPAGVVPATILTSRFHPRDIRRIENSLVSWFLSGFVSGIEAPGPRGRLRYLRALEGSPSRNGRRADIDALAERLRGTWPQLRAQWLDAARERRRVERGHPQTESVADAEPAPRRPLGASRRSPYLRLIDPRVAYDQLVQRVCSRFDVTKEEIEGPAQSRRVSEPRKVLAYLCVQEGLSRAEVGRFFNGRTRASVSYMVKSLTEKIAKDQGTRQLVEELL